MARATLLSPARYQRMGYGLALPDGYTLSTLRSALIQAQDRVSRYVGAPKLPQPFDWRGGTMTDEQHQWKIVNPLAYGPGARRTYLNAGPIKTVTAFSLDLGKTYLVTLDPATDIYVNKMEQYVEIVAVAPTVVGFYPLAINLGLYNPIARVSYTYGWQFEVAGDVLEAESPLIFSGAYGNWDSAVAPAVFLNDVEQDPADYTVNYDDGTITFATAPGPGVQVSADYTYTCPSPIVDAIGMTATSILGSARLAQRGLTGLTSLRVAEVSMTAMNPGAGMSAKNGVSIPVDAAALIDGFNFGSVAA